MSGIDVAAIVVDAVLVFGVLLFVYLQAKKGFVRTLIECVGCFLALYVAFGLGGYISDMIYANTIRSGVASSINQTVEEKGKESIDSAVDAVYDIIPKFITNSAADSGFDRSTVERNVEKALMLDSFNAGETIADGVVKPVVTAIMTFGFSVVLSAVLMFLVHKLAKWINGLFRLPILHGVNSFLGGVLGFVKGVIIMFGVVILISIIINVFGYQFYIFTPKMIDKTYLFKIIYSLSPFGKV